MKKIRYKISLFFLHLLDAAAHKISLIFENVARIFKAQEISLKQENTNLTLILPMKNLIMKIKTVQPGDEFVIYCR